MPRADNVSEDVRKHYEIECRLADKLRNAPAQERTRLYSEVYDELYRLVPNHPQLVRKQERAKAIDDNLQFQLAVVRPFLTPDTVFMEIGAGDCRLSFSVAPQVKAVKAIEVSRVVSDSAAVPDNFELVICNGRTFPVEPGSVTLAYSNQVLEHLHPDDALSQLESTYQALAPGGKYVMVTPNRLSGPHDVSKYFDRLARGFHLKEYTYRELAGLLRRVGFSKITPFLMRQNRLTAYPFWIMRMFEPVCEVLPHGYGSRLASNRLAAALLNIRLIATK